MTLNHSKTWPVSTMAVVQLRVDPNGRTYSTNDDHDAEIIPDHQEYLHDASENIALQGTPAAQKTTEVKNRDNGFVLPLYKKHVELFAKMSGHPPTLRHALRTDTVSTTLEQETELDLEHNGK